MRDNILFIPTDAELATDISSGMFYIFITAETSTRKVKICEASLLFMIETVEMNYELLLSSQSFERSYVSNVYFSHISKILLQCKLKPNARQ